MKEIFRLCNGVNIPKIAFGTWLPTNSQDTVDTIKKAISLGYRR